MTIIVIAIAVWTKNPKMITMYLASQGAAMVFKDSMIADIIQIALVAYSFGTSAATFGANLETFSVISKMANQVNTMYFEYKSQGIIDDIEQVNEDTEEARKEFNEIRREAIYSPLDSPDIIDYISYGVSYDMYSDAYEYDKYYRLPTTVSPKTGYTA